MILSIWGLLYLCTKNETMAPIHVATLTKLLEYELAFGSLPYLCTKNETMTPLHVATLTVQRELSIYFNETI